MSILKTEETLKTLSSEQMYKKPKKQKKNHRTHWAGFKKKTGFFPTLREGGPGRGDGR